MDNAGSKTHFLVLHGKQLKGTLFLRLTTRNCSSGECPDEEVAAEGGVGVILRRNYPTRRRISSNVCIVIEGILVSISALLNAYPRGFALGCIALYKSLLDVATPFQ
jgi:hypothetical protein